MWFVTGGELGRSWKSFGGDRGGECRPRLCFSQGEVEWVQDER